MLGLWRINNFLAIWFTHASYLRVDSSIDTAHSTRWNLGFGHSIYGCLYSSCDLTWSGVPEENVARLPKSHHKGTWKVSVLVLNIFSLNFVCNVCFLTIALRLKKKKKFILWQIIPDCIFQMQITRETGKENGIERSTTYVYKLLISASF